MPRYFKFLEVHIHEVVWLHKISENTTFLEVWIPWEKFEYPWYVEVTYPHHPWLLEIPMILNTQINNQTICNFLGIWIPTNLISFLYEVNSDVQPNKHLGVYASQMSIWDILGRARIRDKLLPLELSLVKLNIKYMNQDQCNLYIYADCGRLSNWTFLLHVIIIKSHKTLGKHLKVLLQIFIC